MSRRPPRPQTAVSAEGRRVDVRARDGNEWSGLFCAEGQQAYGEIGSAGVALALASRPLWRVTHLSACLTQGKAGSGMVTGGFTPVRSSPHWPPEFLPKANRHDQ